VTTIEKILSAIFSLLHAVPANDPFSWHHHERLACVLVDEFGAD